MNHFALRGLARHFLAVLLLNLRSPQSLAYGYAVPVFFLLAFASVFRAGEPPLQDQVGQLVTITILGGACFGLPTALVAERDRGVWRRYRLLPVPPVLLLLSTLLARIVIVFSAVLLQLTLARSALGTPWPTSPSFALPVFFLVTLAFLGIGLLVAALARDVPAVQALGQCLFLPMIMIGGVGVPLAALPDWAQVASGFMPGRYAVELLQHTVTPAPPETLLFPILALAAIGVVSLVAGAACFRWDNDDRLPPRARATIAGALLLWVVVGGVAAATGRLAPTADLSGPEQITEDQIAGITYTELTGDNELVTRLAPPFSTIEERFRVLPLSDQIRQWPRASASLPASERLGALLSLAAMADIHADIREADIGRIVYDQLREAQPHAELRRLLAWFILDARAGTILTVAPEFGFKRELKPEAVRQRAVWYAQKYLGRLEGRLRDAN